MFLKTDINYSVRQYRWRLNCDSRSVKGHTLIGLIALNSDLELLPMGIMDYNQVSYLVRYYYSNYEDELHTSHFGNDLDKIHLYLFKPVSENTGYIQVIVENLKDMQELEQYLKERISDRLQELKPQLQ